MAERVVKVTLSAQVTEYKTAMLEAARATREVGEQGARVEQTRRAMEQLGRGLLVAGGLMATGLGMVVAKYAEFDQAMSNVLATGDEARLNQEELRQAALDAGAATVFSATESANAIEEMAKAGVSAKDILGGGLAGALDLASAGSLGVAEAAGTMSTTLQQFGLDGRDASRVADLLAAGAGKAMGDVSDLGQALNQAGLVANQFGVGVDETVGTLAAFANAGMLGSDAGTSFRTMLLRLANPTGEVKDLMEELGIQVYDASGSFVGMSGLAAELETALDGMTDAQKNQTLAMIFGQDAIRGANILLKEGSDGIKDWTSAVDDQGYAAEVAATKLDNLIGDWEAFTGALETAMIASGEAADGPLRLLVQGLTGLVDGFNELPAWGQQAVFWIGAVGAVAATSAGAFLVGAPKVVAYQAAVEALGPGAQRAARGLSVLAKVGGGAIAGMAVAGVGADLLIDLLRQLGPSAEETANKVATAATGVDLLDSSFDRLISGQGNLKMSKAMVEDLGESLDRLSGKGPAVDGVFDMARITQTQVKLLGQELAKLADTDLPTVQQQFRLLADSAGLSASQQGVLLDQMPELRDALTDVATEAGDSATKQQLLRLAMGEAEVAAESNEEGLRALAGQATDTEESVSDLADEIRNFGSATLDTRDAQRQFEQALDDLTDSVKANGATLDVTTQAGRDNESAVDDLAKTTLEYAAALVEQTGDQDAANAAISDGRSRLIKMLEQFDITGAEAEAYADKLGLIPSNVSTAATLTGVDEAEAEITRLTRDRWMTIRANFQGPNADAIRRQYGFDVANYRGGLYKGGVKEFYQGGFPSGIYAGVRGGIHKFAESEMGVPWETYISGRAADRERNIGLLHRTAALLGVGASGGGVTYNFSGPVTAYDPSEAAREIEKQRRRTVRRSGGF